MIHRYRLGVDVGRTFTDATLLNESTGETRTEAMCWSPWTRERCVR